MVDWLRLFLRMRYDHSNLLEVINVAGASCFGASVTMFFLYDGGTVSIIIGVVALVVSLTSFFLLSGADLLWGV